MTSLPRGLEEPPLRLGISLLVLLGMLVVPLLPALAEGQVFSSDQVWSSGLTNSTAGIALGDVDGDGDLDLVCGNVGQSNTLYLNQSGIFATGAYWLSPAQYDTRAVVLGDVDGDGDLDLVCGNWQQANTLYLNQGGTFSASPAWESGPLNTTSLALGDVDGDGDLDLVCGNDGNSDMLFLNQGGTFSTEPDWSSEAANYTEGIALGDVDGDGDLDLVCGNYNQSNTLYLNQEGTLDVSPAWFSGPTNATTDVALGDIDGDGDLDLVCGCNGQSNVLYLNSGGLFSAEPAWSSAPTRDTHGVALGDVDGDGDLDLMCANYAQSNTLYLNSGGTFSSDPDWLSGPEDRTLAVAPGDIDGDGDLDLVCGNGGYPGRSNAMYLNQVAAFRAEPAWTSTGPTLTFSVALGDINGDGKSPDLVCGNNGYSNTVYLNRDGVFSTRPDWLSGPTNQTRDISLGDVDGDGRLDLVCGNWNEKNTLYLNVGGGFSTSPSWLSDSADATTSVALGDIDGDGDLDLVCGNRDQPNLLYWNEGGTFQTEPGWASGPANPTTSIALGDLDSDGDLDLVCGNFLCSNTVYLNQGGIFEEEPAWSSGPANHTLSIDLGDVDGDGDLDLVCGNDNQRNVLYLNQGGMLSTAPSWLSGPTNHTEAVALGDVDGDGDLDLVCGNFAQTNTMYLNQGGVLGQTPAWSSGSASQTSSLALGDADSDGDLDVVFGNNGNSTLYKGSKNPAFRGDPAHPTNQLPNNSAFLRSVVVSKKYANTNGIVFEAVDVESDPVWVIPEYQYRGAPTWYPTHLVVFSGSVGPLATSPEGEIHVFDWDVSRLPFDQREVVLRLRTVSTPMLVSSIQHIPSYTKEIGLIEPRRPQITLSTDLLSFPTLTVGDTASLHISVSNAGNEVLTITEIELPSAEMRCDLGIPQDIDPKDSVDLDVFLEPRSEIAIAGDLLIESNDPLSPVRSLQITTDIRALEIESRLLSSEPEVPLGQALTVIVTPAPQVRVERGHLYHRPCGAGAFLDSIALSRSAGDFIAVIPGEGVTEAGLEYYIKVENSGVFATDPPGAPDDSVFYQAVASPAAFTVTPHPTSGADFLERRAITVLLSLPQGTEFIEGTLHLRLGGESVYQALALRETELLPTVVIPDSLVGARGLEYWVDVRTLTASLTYPAEDPQSCPAVIRVTVADLWEEAASPGKKYRMITVPLDFGLDFTGTLETLLSDQASFGPYDPLRWRCFRYLPSLGDYVELAEEYAEEFRPLPGKAFWLICSSNSWIGTAPVRGLSTPTDSALSVVLESGWNQVGNPFVFPVAWDSVLIDTLTMAEAESVVVEPPVWWDAAQGYRYGAEILEPFKGYWVKNLHDEPVVMRIPGREAEVGMIPVNNAISALAPNGSVRNGSWQIEIRASSGSAVDFGNYVGIQPGAATCWDKHDRSEPPMNPGRAVSLYFPHHSWKEHPGSYTTDVRGAYEALDTGPWNLALSGEDLSGQVWRFDVAKSFLEKGVGDEVLLEFDGIEGVPAEAKVYLLDLRLGRIQNLRDARTYSFYLGEKGFVSEDQARFMLLGGSQEFVDEHQGELPALPTRTVLHQSYPNPFSASTIIRYDLARSATVALRIYDGKGALVKVLYEGLRDPGRYESAWMGDNQTGHPCAPGIYFCHLRASGDLTQTRKLLLIR